MERVLESSKSDFRVSRSGEEGDKRVDGMEGESGGETARLGKALLVPVDECINKEKDKEGIKQMAKNVDTDELRKIQQLSLIAGICSKVNVELEVDLDGGEKPKVTIFTTKEMQ